MTDILERLRDEFLSMTRNEAADEIERLRGALRKVLELSAGDAGWARQIARAALEGSK